MAGDTEGDTLWYLDGDKPAEVKDAAGNQVSADFLYTELTGDVTVVSATRFDTETTQFYLVADGKAELIVDPKGKPAAGKFYFSSEAGIPLVRGRDETETPSPVFVLIKNVLQPVADAAGKQLFADVCIVQIQPDGRPILYSRNMVNGEFIELPDYWLDGAKATPVEPLKANPDWKSAGSTRTGTYFKGSTLVIDSGSDSTAAWVQRGDKLEWVVTPDGEPLRHESMTVQFRGDTCYIIGAENAEDKEKPSSGHIYRYADGKATELNVTEGEHLGMSWFLPDTEAPVLVAESDVSIEELWIIVDDVVCPLKTPDGKHARLPETLASWLVDGKWMVKYMTPQGYHWGRVDGSTITPVCSASRDEWSIENPWRSLDGDLFLVRETISHASFRRVAGGESELLATEDGDRIEGVSLQVVAWGKRFLVVADRDDKKTVVAYSSYTVHR